MAVVGVNVSVEAVLENQIQEVTLDGQEIYVPPLSMSENLTKQAHKIDFYKDETEEKGKPASEGEQDSEEKTTTPFQPSLWPWDSVRNKLKNAFTEVSVLLDVLNIAKEKHYMVLDQVSQEPPESRPGVHMLAKKRSLVSAANIVLAGADCLKRSQAEMTNKSQTDFHFELLRLRQNWRLKKVGTSILGDLSYKSAGSRFWQGGTFEVVKCKAETSDRQDATTRALEVIIPSELEGVAYIQVEIKHVPDSMDLTNAILKIPTGLGQVPTDAYWQRKLEVAQNVLFCKELFAKLACEAVQAKTSSPHLVVGNQIITNVFPGVQLSIVLCHSTGKDKKQSNVGPHKLEHNHVLEHSLHQLLREVHFKAINHHPPHPVIATLGISQQRRMAGPTGMSRSELQQMIESETLLEQIIKQTRHEVLRLRMMKVLDELSSTLSDPLIACHWSCLNSSLESVVKVTISSHGYDYRPMLQSFILVIGVDSVKAITKEGRTFFLSFEGKDLKDLVMWQLSQHHIMVAQILAKMMGWQELSSSGNCGLGDMESVGTASSIMMVPPCHDRVLCVKSGPSRGAKVCVKSLLKEGTLGLSAVTDPKWKNIGGEFQDVDIDKIEGRNFAAKLELLMSILSKSEPH